MTPNERFWAQQRVLLTGHTGFKGTWLSLWLEHLGAKTVGLALEPETDPSLFNLTTPQILESCIGDVRDADAVAAAVARARPTIAIHMAAQALVRHSYRRPFETLQTNILGTANLLEALRGAGGLQAVLVITSDKVYRNAEAGRAFREDDPLGGHDPYSASKAAAEVVAESYAHSFYAGGAAVATARAGNVVGGGDWAEDRLVPDAWRANIAGAPLLLRNPKATRPWQHVLDLLAGYLVYAERLVADSDGLPRAFNFGPAVGDTMTVAEMADAVLAGLHARHGWQLAQGPQPEEKQTLSLDASLARRTLGWQPRFSVREAIAKTVEWYTAFDQGADPRKLCLDQIVRYEATT